jgi:hypothetical protein
VYDGIKAELEDEKNLEIVSEYKGETNDKPLRSIVAVNKSLKVFAGSLREIHISILSTPDDYAVEVASGAWFGSILFPGAGRLIIGGPIGLVWLSGPPLAVLWHMNTRSIYGRRSWKW